MVKRSTCPQVADLSQKLDEVAGRDADGVIAELNEQLAEKDGRLVELQAAVVVMEETLVALERKVVDLSTELSDKTEEITLHDADIARFSKLLEQRNLDCAEQAKSERDTADDREGDRDDIAEEPGDAKLESSSQIESESFVFGPNNDSSRENAFYENRAENASCR